MLPAVIEAKIQQILQPLAMPRPVTQPPLNVKPKLNFSTHPSAELLVLSSFFCFTLFSCRLVKLTHVQHLVSYRMTTDVHSDIQPVTCWHAEDGKTACMSVGGALV